MPIEGVVENTPGVLKPSPLTAVSESLADTIKVPRIGDWQRLQHDRVNERKHRSIDSNPQGHSQNGDGCEARAPAEMSKTVSAIGDHGVKQIANPCLANVHFHLLNTANLDARGTQ